MIKRLILISLFALGMNAYTMDNQDYPEDKSLLGRKRNSPSIKNSEITKMDLSNDKDLTDLSFLNNFPVLVELDLSYCPNLGDNYKKLRELPNLKKLNLLGTSVDNHKPLKYLHSLDSLSILCSDLEKSMKYISSLKNLEELQIGGAHLQGLKQISSLTRLKRLTIRFVENDDQEDIFPTLDFISPLKDLEYLNLSNQGEIVSIEPLIHLPKLKKMNLSGCCYINDIEKLKHLKSLQFILVKFWYKEDVDFLKKTCPNLNVRS